MNISRKKMFESRIVVSLNIIFFFLFFNETILLVKYYFSTLTRISFKLLFEFQASF